MLRRGAMIVLEGCDRCGKSTQATLLVDRLKDAGHPALLMRFPDRSTAIGRQISAYLSNETYFPDKAIHMLFSANRWELEAQIKKLLLSGTTLIVDRYCYSGVAYSSIKPGMNTKWCWECEEGLPAADLVFLLEANVESIATRSGYGEERYEKKEMQQKVAHAFRKMANTLPSWKIINADRSVEEISDNLFDLAKEVCCKCSDIPISLISCPQEPKDEQNDSHQK